MELASTIREWIEARNKMSISVVPNQKVLSYIFEVKPPPPPKEGKNSFDPEPPDR